MGAGMLGQRYELEPPVVRAADLILGQRLTLEHKEQRNLLQVVQLDSLEVRLSRICPPMRSRSALGGFGVAGRSPYRLTGQIDDKSRPEALVVQGP